MTDDRRKVRQVLDAAAREARMPERVVEAVRALPDESLDRLAAILKTAKAQPTRPQ